MRWRSRRHDLPALDPAPPVDQLPTAKLQAGARYFGTTTSDQERVRAHGLGPRSTARLSLSADALDVIRLAGSFRIPSKALRGATHEPRFVGKVVSPNGVLVVSWQQGEYLLRTGFRLDDGTDTRHHAWVRSVNKLAKERS